MTKKIFALVMVISVLGAFVAGCKGSEEPAATTTGTTAAATAGTPPAATTTAGTAGETGK